MSGGPSEPRVAGDSTWRRRLVGFQAAYYLSTGLWPVIHLPSFEAITGSKTDDWLVHMVGLLAAVIGVTLAVSVSRGRAHASETVILASTSALAFAAIDLRYALGGVIAPIYLADAVVQGSLLLGLRATRSR